MRRLIVVAAFLAAGCAAGDAPADQPPADPPAEAAQTAGTSGDEGSEPPTAVPAVQFEHDLSPAEDRSRRAHDALIEACRASPGTCRVVVSDIQRLSADEVFGDMTLEIDRAQAEAFNRFAVRVVQAAPSEIVQSRTLEVPPPAAAGAGSPPERVRLLFHFKDPRSGLQRGLGRVARNIAATAGLLFVIIGSIAPWLLLAWLLARLNSWRQRRKDARVEAERQGRQTE
jgi:hypothetical protein